MAKPKKIPMRKCVGCGVAKPKAELMRVVRNQEQEVFIDETGKANGRGAYICKDEACLHKAQKSKAFHRALGAEIPAATFEVLRESLKDL
ncbi:Protein of uncharacterised function (DUF448) [Aedoeadaptatus ivorii]|uniref:Protein of uncharacterized function (DUF448) n=1 Tax=Aedoeadaptatus ivorii TaxID=54006 RepID=A0A448V1D4_9FIRM|nr:YlxR family protein [Peptoniphilus ivorii]MDQ0507812.1 putative RNA-binding protein YlxR (DUF448 family) [Peptoniphilus ivorii]VEJ35639.1 Protein of uncharacterised function (DUF448) [Peptoniphilus ivorii]